MVPDAGLLARRVVSIGEEFEFVDAVPEPGNPVPTSGGPVCSVCGTSIPYAGRGRKPTLCDDHKNNRKSAPTGGRKSAVVERAISELGMMYGLAGIGLKYASPAAGEIVYENREKLAESYRMLLETNDRIRKLFADIEGKAAWLPIVIVHGDIVAAIMFARAIEKAQRIEPDGEQESPPGLFAVPNMGTVPGV